MTVMFPYARAVWRQGGRQTLSSPLLLLPAEDTGLLETAPCLYHTEEVQVDLHGGFSVPGLLTLQTTLKSCNLSSTGCARL